MCVAAFDWQPGTEQPLRLLSNRDEFFARPTLPMAWWVHGSHRVLSGRDERAGGTWLALSPMGRVALVTNVRRGLPEPSRPRSRGELPLSWLSAESPQRWAQTLQAEDYAPFNLVGFDLARGTAVWVHADGGQLCLHDIEPGLHGLSNGRLNEPWPKTTRLMAALRSAAHAADAWPALLDDTPAPEHALPDTGLEPARERALSPVFIAPSADTPTEVPYGTRASTVVGTRRRSDGLEWQVTEWQHLPGQRGHGRRDYRFTGRP